MHAAGPPMQRPLTDLDEPGTPTGMVYPAGSIDCAAQGVVENSSKAAKALAEYIADGPPPM